MVCSCWGMKYGEVLVVMGIFQGKGSVVWDCLSGMDGRVVSAVLVLD